MTWGQGGVPSALRAKVLRRDGYQCQLQYGRATEVDHIIGVAELGVSRAAEFFKVVESIGC
jgi:5-methylcytosine-specific restriction endonuclease McrA